MGPIEDKEANEKDLILPLVPSDDPILREELPLFDFNNPSMHPAELAHTLAQNCIHYKGLGLAANQLGLRERALIINAQPMLCMINPVIVNASEQQSYGEKPEGCLSFHNLFIKVKRPEVVRVRYTLPNGETKTQQFAGMTSRVVQHEIDHLDGILYMDRANDIHLEQARKKKKKLDRREKNGKGKSAGVPNYI